VKQLTNMKADLNKLPVVVTLEGFNKNIETLNIIHMNIMAHVETFGGNNPVLECEYVEAAEKSILIKEQHSELRHIDSLIGTFESDLLWPEAAELLQKAVRKRLPMGSIKRKSNEQTTISDTIRDGFKAMTASMLHMDPESHRSLTGKRSRSNSRDSKGSKRSEGVCFDWTKGRCARGDTCRFSHLAKSPPSPGPTVQFKSVLKK
jgi:hypothetical protein